MAELVWSLNGKYFKDFGVGISSSDGILGELKPKKQDTKDWSEYNGVALDLTKKPKYEAREFTLSGWIVGADWLTMLNNFNALFGEFRNAGKQRLLLDVFGQKTLVFDVRCDDEIKLKKTFKQGKMVGMFSLKLIEHNPIKKILYTANSNLQLAFNTPKWVEVNVDGKIDVYKGTVNINKALTNRAVTGYNFEGRNLLQKSQGSFKPNINSLDNYQYYADSKITLTQGTQYVLSAKTNGIFSNIHDTSTQSDRCLIWLYNADLGVNAIISDVNTGTKGSVFTWNYPTEEYILRVNVYHPNSTNQIKAWNLKIEKGNKTTDWTPAPEDQHFINIAGNIDEITGLTTNATVLWEKL